MPVLRLGFHCFLFDNLRYGYQDIVGADASLPSDCVNHHFISHAC
jgi:hypothetical protein